ncbi:PspA/IM30 family protein [Corynebacterium segmentosum]
MANPFSKGWKYVMSSLDQKIDENADPKVQIQQAVKAAKEQHQEISDHAAEIIGHKSQLEMQMNRLVKSQQDYQSQTELADSAEDPQKANEYNQAAEVVASQLVAVEQELEDVKQQHAAAEQAAEQAKNQQKQSEARLKEQLAQVSQLEAQADQAAMQEKNAEALDSMNELKPDDSVPSLDSVRSKIEKRYADALGAQELQQATGGDRMSEIQAAGNDMKASARLDALRADMAKKKEIESGD